MLIVKQTEETTASASAIWRIWEDVNNWNSWDQGIEFSTVDGPFEAETAGVLKPKGGPPVHIRLTRVEPLKRFVSESKLFLARIIVSHDLTDDGQTRFVTHQIEMTGPLAFLFAYLIGRPMKKNLPSDMRAMIQQAESHEKSQSV